MPDDLSLREIIKKEFEIDLPISGGDGGSIDSAIIIDGDYKDWSNVEYSCIKLLNQLLGRTWKLVNTSLIEKDGRKYDQMKIEIEGDSNNFYNYYFDITDNR